MDLESGQAKLEAKKVELERQSRNLAAQKLEKDREYKKLQILNESVASEIMRIKAENTDLERLILEKDNFVKQQQSELVNRTEYKRRFGTRKRFLCF